MKIKLYLALFTFAFTVVYLGMDNLIVENPEVKLAEHNQLIMYSLTNCSSCAEKKREFKQANISYIEYVIDRQPNAGRELMNKLDQAGFPYQRVGYPSFDVRGTLIPNNPSLMQIRKHLPDEDT